MRKKLLIAIGVCLFVFACSTLLKNNEIKSYAKPFNASLAEIDLSEVKNLMIVAHPDDEIIWGGKHLQDKKYLVVCLTNGATPRANEFYKALEHTASIGYILDYPDKIDNQRSDWKNDRANIEQDIYYLIQAKQWDSIVTHNPDGEYGHDQHKQTNQMVTQASIQQDMSGSLYYFGKYYRKGNISNDALKKTKMSQSDLKMKNKALAPYTSQKKVKEKLEHMFPYENWESYLNW